MLLNRPRLGRVVETASSRDVGRLLSCPMTCIITRSHKHFMEERIISRKNHDSNRPLWHIPRSTGLAGRPRDGDPRKSNCRLGPGLSNYGYIYKCVHSHGKHARPWFFQLSEGGHVFHSSPAIVIVRASVVLPSEFV